MEIVVSNFFRESPSKSQPGGSSDFFGPPPKEMEQRAEEVKSQSGEDSLEYASALVKVGDAHMVQGNLANPQAQKCYEQAMKIVSGKGETTAETAYVFDKLAIVKQSSGDTASAVVDLLKAIEIWKQFDANSRFVTDEYVGRRVEDLTRMQRVEALRNRRPPDL